jgi:hypothetical protein
MSGILIKYNDGDDDDDNENSIIFFAYLRAELISVALVSK